MSSSFLFAVPTSSSESESRHKTLSDNPSHHKVFPFASSSFLMLSESTKLNFCDATKYPTSNSKSVLTTVSPNCPESDYEGNPMFLSPPY